MPKRRKAQESVGEAFGRLKVNSVFRKILPHSKKSETYAACSCDCGNESVHCLASLRRGHIVSCGCYNLELARKKGLNNATHGHCRRLEDRTRAYKTWCSILRRCLTPSASGYVKYGAKGITVCDRWMKFEKFLEDMGEPPDGLSIDRIDSTKGYSPDNCRWTDIFTQARNKNWKKYCGVFQTRSKRDYHVRFSIKKKHYHYKGFSSKEDAADFRELAIAILT